MNHFLLLLPPLMTMVAVARVVMMDVVHHDHHWVDIHIPGVVVVVDNVDDGRGVGVPHLRSVGCGSDVAFFLILFLLNSIYTLCSIAAPMKRAVC